jgi:hypothetical protein
VSWPRERGEHIFVCTIPRNLKVMRHQLMRNSSDSFFDQVPDTCHDAREAATEAIRRLLIWMADAPTLEDRGLRASVALYCLRPDLINRATLESIGDATGRTRQAVFNLAKDFRLTIDAL